PFFSALESPFPVRNLAYPVGYLQRVLGITAKLFNSIIHVPIVYYVFELENVGNEHFLGIQFVLLPCGRWKKVSWPRPNDVSNLEIISLSPPGMARHPQCKFSSLCLKH